MQCYSNVNHENHIWFSIYFPPKSTFNISIFSWRLFFKNKINVIFKKCNWIFLCSFKKILSKLFPMHPFAIIPKAPPPPKSKSRVLSFLRPKWTSEYFGCQPPPPPSTPDIYSTWWFFILLLFFVESSLRARFLLLRIRNLEEKNSGVCKVPWKNFLE